MNRKPPRQRIQSTQKRLAPDDRRQEFVAKATVFFSEQGFRRQGVLSQWTPIICRFPVRPHLHRGKLSPA